MQTLSSFGVTSVSDPVCRGCSISDTQCVTLGITVAALSRPGNSVLFTTSRSALELIKALWFCMEILRLGGR